MIGTDQFSLYETLGVLVPGTLLIYSLLILFPDLKAVVATSNSAINAGAFAAVAIFAGQMVQALASFSEPLLFKLWGGRPSEQALHKGLGLRYLPQPSATRLRNKLSAAVNRPDSQAQDLFLYAMRRASTAAASRVETFNAQFAYHRSLVTLGVLLLALVLISRWRGALSLISRGMFWTCLIGDLMVLVVLFIRTRQRAFYYVREVLFTAEHVLDGEAKR